MEFFQEFFKNIWVMRIISSIVVITCSFCLYQLLHHVIKKQSKKGNLKFLFNNKTKTYVKLMKNITRYLFIGITVLILLEVFGINVSSLLAGVGIIGIIVGFAIQDALKDIIKGFDILSDSYYQVGDVIKYGDIVGKVLSIGLKTTKVEDIYTLNIVSISNRNIEQVEIVSNLINIDVPFPYEVKLKKAESVLGSMVERIEQRENIEKCEYRGVNRFDDSSIAYQIKVYCNPLEKVQVRRDALHCILEVFEENKIDIPYQQIDIHQK